MDTNWERCVDFFDLPNEALQDLLQRIAPGLRLLGQEKIREGCRNTNYKVRTDQGMYLLRILLGGEKALCKERAALRALKGKVRMPTMLGTAAVGTRVAVLYEYLAGEPLHSTMERQGGISPSVLEQAAHSAALIHSVTPKEAEGIRQEPLPPFSTWCDVFLDNPLAAQRLGEPLVRRTRQLFHRRGEMLAQIDALRSFIHCDFRPANMIVDSQGQLYLVDWEYAGFGHTLADLGQFFRFGAYFQPADRERFAAAYQEAAQRPLPQNWYRLARLRDLINPLQMLGVERNLPNMQADLVGLVRETVLFFEEETKEAFSWQE